MSFFSIPSKLKHGITVPPLLCWGDAHPLLQKRINIAEDLAKIAELKAKFEWQIALPFQEYLVENHSIVITNLDKEIIWISHDFVRLTGYSANELLGKKPLILQGSKTNEKIVAKIREKLIKFEHLKVKILNYRKNGESYNCDIEIFPIKNDEGIFTHFVAIEKEVS